MFTSTGAVPVLLDIPELEHLVTLGQFTPLQMPEMIRHMEQCGVYAGDLITKYVPGGEIYYKTIKGEPEDVEPGLVGLVITMVAAPGQENP